MRKRTVLLAAASVAAMATAGATSSTAGGRPSPVTLSAHPSAVEVVPMPCLPSGEVEVGMTNTGDEDLIADMTLRAERPLELSREVFSSYLPAADPDYEVTAPLTVRVPRGTAPGDYEVRLSADRQRLSLPVEVLPEPAKGPGDNLLLGEQAVASSTHGNVTLCGGVEGDTDSERWGDSGWHDATRFEFPDSYGVDLLEPVQIGRVELYTLDSNRYPADEMGLRDWDVQVRTGGEWVTVDEIRGNTQGHVVSRFTPVQAEGVRLVVHDSNDHKYSRIVELEAYSS